MSNALRTCGIATFVGLTLGFLGVESPVRGDNIFNSQGQEYSIIGSLAGDQVYPQAAISPFGGYVVWQDNITDGDGLGISARRLDSSLSGSLSVFRVNAQGANDQEKPQVATLNNGGAV